jgi:hypothetical protein
MSFFRRRESLHERLAREGGLDESPPPVDPGPHWGEVGIHGVPRLREWDAVVTAEAPELEGASATFVALENGDLIEEEGPDGDLTPLADAIESQLAAPYRAQAVRKGAEVWTVAARRIRVAELQEVTGDELTLAVNDGQKALMVDGEQGFGSVPALERLGEGDSFVIEAKRLDGALFEFKVSPL